ncbi:MAG TPA: D-glycero-beta-D-manno-heptose 1,7-bisphosphate 7-phosphatase [Deltaproteobacteria bacterium]|nr:D-glycero-beta-D-manno-heptose 1,7-bisphosphate 7-phosphatase [Deltaproteobacteria bacterium]
MKKESKRRAAVFLDRDGTINVDDGYIGDPDDIVLIDGAAEAVRMLGEAGLPVVVVTNQSGIGRGYYDEDALRRVNERVARLLEAGGGRVEGFYHCPHPPEAGCRCRKPATGLVERAAAELAIDPAASYVVGDKVSDMELARRVSARAVLVLTGFGAKAQEELRFEPHHTAADLLEAARWITADFKGGRDRPSH